MRVTLIVIGFICECIFSTTCIAPTNVNAASLDDPATPNQPTIRGEIYRARRAVIFCTDKLPKHMISDLEAISDVYAYGSCYDHLVYDSARIGSYSRAFELGVWFAKAIDFTSTEDSYASRPESKFARAMKTIRDEGQSALHLANKQAAEIGITMEQICEAAEWKECEAQVLPRLQKLDFIKK